MDTQARRESLVRMMRECAKLSVDEIADELEVSRRTVLRDLAALRDRGFSIASDAGPGGGVELDPRTVLVSAQLAADEVVALVLSVALLRTAPFMPFAGRADAALSKIEGALPPERVRELRRLLRRVLVGDPAKLREGDAPGAVDPLLLPAFESAFRQRVVLTFDYVDRQQRPSFRTIEPHALLVRAPLWYVIAWDRDQDAVRLFRMDRIQNPRVAENERFGPRPLELVLGVCPDAKKPARPR